MHFLSLFNIFFYYTLFGNFLQDFKQALRGFRANKKSLSAVLCFGNDCVNRHIAQKFCDDLTAADGIIRAIYR